MDYQKITNLLGNTPNQPTKFRTKNWVEIDDGLLGTCGTGSQMKFENAMLNSSLYDYSDAFLLVSAFLCHLKTQQPKVQMQIKISI